MGDRSLTVKAVDLSTIRMNHDAYYLEEVLAITSCGFLALVMVANWSKGLLGHFVDTAYHPWVLVGCVLLFGLVTIRSLVVGSFLAGFASPVGWCRKTDSLNSKRGRLVLWQYGLLFLPVVLHFLVPATGFARPLPTALQASAKFPRMSIPILERAAQSVEGRNHFEGKTVCVSGKLRVGDDKQVSLWRFAMRVREHGEPPGVISVMIDPEVDERLPWHRLDRNSVRVTGRLRFVQRKGTDSFMPVLILTPTPERPLGSFVEVIPPEWAPLED